MRQRLADFRNKASNCRREKEPNVSRRNRNEHKRNEASAACATFDSVNLVRNSFQRTEHHRQQATLVYLISDSPDQRGFYRWNVIEQYPGEICVALSYQVHQ